MIKNLRLLWMSVASAALLLAGCKPAPPPPASSKQISPPTPATSAVTRVEAGSEQDRLWARLMRESGPPVTPEEWQEEPPTPEAIEAWKQVAGERAVAAAAMAREFHARYPEDERAGDARGREYAELSTAFGLGHTNVAERLGELEAASLADLGLPDSRRFELRVQRLHRTVQMVRTAQSIGNALEEMERGVRELRGEFPERSEVNRLMITVARGWLEQGDAARSQAVVDDVLNNNPERDVKESAVALRAKLDLLGKPLELKFTAWDGREVDLGNLRGKVVLIDFWATWCAPCMEGLSELRQLYQELRPQGFEILGISFDQDRSHLEKIVRRESLDWPHYFEDHQTGNRFGQQFGISGIPTLWLVDKQGRLRELNARQQLRAKIERLLAE